MSRDPRERSREMLDGPHRAGARSVLRAFGLGDVYEAIGACEQDLIDAERLTTIEKAACPGIGTCADTFSANTMVSVSEALGLTVVGMALEGLCGVDPVTLPVVLGKIMREDKDAVAAR